MKIIASQSYTYNSSCYFFDLRNSTTIIRKLASTRSSLSVSRLEYHSKMMIKIYSELERILKELNPNEYYINDTGDGHLCLIREDNHALLILKVACHMAEFVKPLIVLYNEEQGIRDIDLKIDFGIGIHSGGSVFRKVPSLKKSFAYGIVLNSAARVESFTKTFPDTKLLFTQTFKTKLLGQLNKETSISSSEIKKQILQVTSIATNIKDGKSKGHKLYTLPESHWKEVGAWLEK